MANGEEQRGNEPSAASILKKFYDNFGWQIDKASGLLNNHTYFQDMDDAATKYRYDHELRHKSIYGDGGKYFLDAGCGGSHQSDRLKAVYFDGSSVSVYSA